MLLERLSLALGVVLLAGAAHASELDAARKDAESGTASLEQRPCPVLGDRTYVRGLSDGSQLTAAAQKERAYEDGAVQQLQQMARDPKLAPRQRADLQGLASWSIAASMANWSILQLAQQALANPLIAAGQPSPTVIIESASARAHQLADNNTLAPDAAAVVRRQGVALDRCTKSFTAAIFKLNQPQFDAAIGGAKSNAELNQLEQLYHARDAASAGYGGDSLDKLASRRAELTEAEQQARDNANAANAADAAKRQAEAEKRRAELRARLPAYLAVAKRFAEASQAGNERAALAELSQNVIMTTPQGSYRGIDQVTLAVRQQAAAGQKGSLGTPRIEGDRILANGSSGGYQLTTTFSFDESNHISRMDITL